MPSYSYIAINNTGKTVKGKVSAANEIDLEDRLEKMGLDIIRYREQRSGSSFGGKIQTRDLILFCVHLEQLDKAGVPLLDSLADLRDAIPSPKFRDLMTDIYEQVKSGSMLSEAMSKHPRIFGEVFVGLIKTGEETGQLTEAFHHLGQHLKWNDELKRKIKKAIRYPIGLLFLMSGVVAVMMMFVVPQLSTFLTSQGFDLPIHTRALIATSDAFVEYWYIIFGIPVVLVIFLIIGYRNSESFAYLIDKITLKLPFLGQVALKSNLSRFCHFFAVTYISGIDILECLATAQNVVGNRVIKENIYAVRQNVSQGNSLTLSLEATEIFPNLVLRMFKVGEESGNMEDALHNINFFYDREVNDAVEIIVGIIQPTLILVLGAIMGWIALAVFGPLYESFSKLDL